MFLRLQELRPAIAIPIHNPRAFAREKELNMPGMKKTGALLRSGEGSDHGPNSETSTSAELRPNAPLLPLPGEDQPATQDTQLGSVLPKGLLQRISQLPKEPLNLGGITDVVTMQKPRSSRPSASRRQRGSQRRTSNRAPKHLPKKRGGRRHG
jgi:hypothetical protein